MIKVSVKHSICFQFENILFNINFRIPFEFLYFRTQAFYILIFIYLYCRRILRNQIKYNIKVRLMNIYISIKKRCGF